MLGLLSQFRRVVRTLSDIGVSLNDGVFTDSAVGDTVYELLALRMSDRQVELVCLLMLQISAQTWSLPEPPSSSVPTPVPDDDRRYTRW
jgi:hypothetical protein